MENIPVLYLVYVLLGGLLAVIAIWSRRTLAIKIAAIGLFAALVGLNYGALINLLGRPQPVDSFSSTKLEEDAIVIAASIAEGQAIYLWLRHPQQHQSRYYSMEWDEQDATALKKAMDRSSREGSEIMMKPHFEQSLESNKEPLFYTLPRERLPLKPPQDVYEYRRPGNSA